MKYQTLMDSVLELAFVSDREEADACVKAVIGLLASLMEEEAARRFIDPLPSPLTFEKLRADQKRPTYVSPEDGVAALVQQFSYDEDQVGTLLHRVTSILTSELGEAEVSDMRESLPDAWRAFLNEDPSE